MLQVSQLVKEIGIQQEPCVESVCIDFMPVCTSLLCIESPGRLTKSLVCELGLGRLPQGMNAKPVSIKKVTQYSANWVRSQSRMSSTSNQETWRADIAGRVVFDLLRQVYFSLPNTVDVPFLHSACSTCVFNAC